MILDDFGLFPLIQMGCQVGFIIISPGVSCQIRTAGNPRTPVPPTEVGSGNQVRMLM